MSNYESSAEQPPADGYGGPPAPPPPPAPPQGGGGYSASTAWTYGWNKFTANLGSILLAVIVLVAATLVIQGIGYFVGRAVACDPEVTVTGTTIKTNDCGGILTASNMVSWVFSLISWIVQMIIGAGIVRGALAIVEGREFDPKILLTPYRLGEVVVASLITGVLTFLGFFACIIGAFVVAFFTSFTLYFLMDREDLGAWDAVKASFQFTKDHAGEVIVWFLLALVTYIVGACLCGVGLIAAVPVIIIGTAYTYKTLTGQAVAA